VAVAVGVGVALGNGVAVPSGMKAVDVAGPEVGVAGMPDWPQAASRMLNVANNAMVLVIFIGTPCSLNKGISLDDNANSLFLQSRWGIYYLQCAFWVQCQTGIPSDRIVMQPVVAGLIMVSNRILVE
jgi:hypothetical protein